MEKETVERITFQITNLTELTHGYILNCRCEGKSPTTITTYDEHLKRFLWYCQEVGFSTEPQKITTYHIRDFLWYIASEPVRWNGSSTTAKRPAGQSTVNYYYRVLNTFFRWLKQEGLIYNNPVDSIKTPKIDRTESSSSPLSAGNSSPSSSMFNKVHLRKSQ